MATQPIGNVSFNDDDIFDIPTQRVVNDDVYDAATQLQPSQNDGIYDAATQLQPDTNDIFDAPTQRLNVQNGSESPDPKSSIGIRSGSLRVRAFDSQLSPVKTPEWSMAKLLPKEPINVAKKSVSKKEENLKRKQQWIFNTSDNEDDNEGDDDDDDLDFDLTPNRHSMLNSSTESKPATLKSDPKPQNNPKSVDREKPAESLGERKPENEAPISNNISKPAKRTRSLSIVVSRDEVSEYLKSDKQMSVSSNLVAKSKRKPQTIPQDTSTPKNNGKSKKKTETAVKEGSGTKTEPNANKTSQTTLKDVPVTRNLRTKNNNNSLIGKDNKNTLKRKSDDSYTDENQKQPRKRVTKATETMIPSKFRDYQTESKITKNDIPMKEEKTKVPGKKTIKSNPKINKPPNAASVVREVRFIYTITKFNI